jgi:hypothetical protein
MVPKIFAHTFMFGLNNTLSSLETVLNLAGQSGILVGIALGPRGLEGGSGKVFYASLSLTIDGTQVFSFNSREGIEALLSFFGEEQGSRLLFRLPFNNSVSLTAQVRRDGTTGPNQAVLIALVLLN